MMHFFLKRFLLILIFLLPEPLLAIEVDELLKHIDDLWRGNSSKATMTMTVKTRRYSRSMTMQSWSKGKNLSLVVIDKPIKDKGIATLKVENNIWNYLPKISRVTKVPSSMMSGSWMGSHFTNDDLVKESTFEEDYVSTITLDGNRNDIDIYEITSIPTKSAAIVWGKVVVDIRKDNLVPIEYRYYDEEGLLIRTMKFSDTQKIGKRLVPMKMMLIPEDKPEESTEIIYQDIAFDLGLEDSFFSLQNLQQRRLR